MASTIIGKSGRIYAQKEVLQRHHDDPKLSVFKATSGSESFIFKRVTSHFYDLSLHLTADFAGSAGSSRLRMHVDCNEGERILIYPYFNDTLLALVDRDLEFPVCERMRVLHDVGEAIHALHSKDWVHLDVKPDNVLVNWDHGSDGGVTVTDVALGDFDIIFKSERGAARQTPYAVGDAMWRSPEGQTGRGMTKASDIFSFGLVCIFTLGGGGFLLLNDFQDLLRRGMRPEQEILSRHFCYFGLVPEGLLQHVDDAEWTTALKAASEVAAATVDQQSARTLCV